MHAKYVEGNRKTSLDVRFECIFDTGTPLRLFAGEGQFR